MYFSYTGPARRKSIIADTGGVEKRFVGTGETVKVWEARSLERFLNQEVVVGCKYLYRMIAMCTPDPGYKLSEWIRPFR